MAPMRSRSESIVSAGNPQSRERHLRFLSLETLSSLPGHPAGAVASTGCRTDDLVCRRRDRREATGGTVHQTFGSLAGLCIPLFRPHRAKRVPDGIAAAGAGGLLAAASSGRGSDHQRRVEPAHAGLHRLGGVLCPQPEDPGGMGRKGPEQRRLRAPLPAPLGARPTLRGVFHFPGHGTRVDLPPWLSIGFEGARASRRLSHFAQTPGTLSLLLLLSAR